MNTKIKKFALAITVAGLAVLGTGVPANAAHGAPMKAQNIWCC